MQQNENPNECLKPLNQLLCSIPCMKLLHFSATMKHGERKKPSQWVSSTVCLVRFEENNTLKLVWKLVCDLWEVSESNNFWRLNAKECVWTKWEALFMALEGANPRRHSMVINCESPNHCQKAIKASWNGKLTNKGEFTTLGGKRAFEMWVLCSRKHGLAPQAIVPQLSRKLSLFTD